MPSAWVRFDIRQVGRKIALVLLVWLVLNVAFAFFFVRPRQQEFTTLRDDSRPRLEALAERLIEQRHS